MEDIDQAFDRLSHYFLRPEVWRSMPAMAAPVAVPAGRPPDLSLRRYRGPIRRAVRKAGVACLDLLARVYLARVRPRCVAIAGLQGKTVMKRWLREMFEGCLRVRANPRSYNTEIGLPLAILDAPIEGPRARDLVSALVRSVVRGLFASDSLDLMILEMGIRRRGDARALLRAVTPDILVLTPLAPSFTGDLSFLETVEEEVAFLSREVSGHGGQLIVCEDDPRLVAAVASLPGVRRYRREQVKHDDGRMALKVDDRCYEVGVDVVGESAGYALLAGIEIAEILGVDEEVIRAFLRGPSNEK
jgi:UDP-N-acetylmuramyl pentapeptide synthase